MKTNPVMRQVVWMVGAAVLTAGSSLPGRAQAAAGQKTFPSASVAAAALVSAAKEGNQAELLEILGPDAKELIDSGDPVADKLALQKFVKSYMVKHSLKPQAQGVETLVIGASDYPTPIPIVRDGTNWYFDSARGKDEVLHRRIGENELGAIAVCEGYVVAQNQYSARGHDGLPKGIFAQKLASEPGKHDGLYWEVEKGKPQSPLGPAVAEAAAEGYQGESGPSPYHGYFYKLLKEQGPDAPGGAKSYLVDGKLSGGFALLAYPANYGNGGIMSFLVDQDGTILQKDLGEDTVNAAKQITAYNPDSSWTPAQ